MQNGLLMRWWCADVASDSEWSSVTQIVIPTCYRHLVLSLAHDHDLSGHLGIKNIPSNFETFLLAQNEG